MRGRGTNQLSDSLEQASGMEKNGAETTGFIPNVLFHSKCIYCECRTISPLQTLHNFILTLFNCFNITEGRFALSIGKTA